MLSCSSVTMRACCDDSCRQWLCAVAHYWPTRVRERHAGRAHRDILRRSRYCDGRRFSCQYQRGHRAGSSCPVGGGWREVFSDNMRGGREVGGGVRSVVDAGELVSDELTGDLVRDRLSQPDAVRGFLLDGYPRNVAQAAQLDAFLSADGHQLDAVIALNVPRAESVRRLSQRAVEQGRADDTEAL